jgi:quinol---cytochrome c reductase iron-sulfur subunit, bacillus type
MSGEAPDTRRAFLAMLTAGIGALVGAIAVIPGLGLLAAPLRRAIVRGAGQPLRVAAEQDVKPQKPIRVTAVGEVQDAWLRLDHVTVGSCWLVRATEGAPIRAFSTICPHLGCGVDWNDKTGKFDCPCHASSFDLEGRCLSGPSPRGLDELEVTTDGEDVLVQVQRFRTGTATKEPIG